MAHQEIPLLHLLKSLITQLMMSLLRLREESTAFLFYTTRQKEREAKMISGVAEADPELLLCLLLMPDAGCECGGGTRREVI